MADAILIVDDVTVRMTLVDALRGVGFAPIACTTGEQARRALISETVKLAVLDVRLPDADGVELLREIRENERTRRLPVVMLSSEAQVADRIAGLRQGADYYVAKPFDTACIVARAQELTRRTATRDTKPLVLVIDDSVTFRAALEREIAGAGYAVLSVGTGEEGLLVAASARPDAIVVDSLLPGMDGLALIRRIRLDGALRASGCMLLTASDGSDGELAALDAGVDAYVRKEQAVSIILARLAAMLRRRPSRYVGVKSLAGPNRILAVDDSSTQREVVVDLLEKEGYDVARADSGEAALECLALQSVDCVLLDLGMPGMGGMETCRRIKEAPMLRDVPVIMHNGRDDRSLMLEALGMGADDYLAKGIEPDLLKARIRALLRRKQVEDEGRSIREDLRRAELATSKERAARELAESRAAAADALAQKNAALEKARVAAEAASDAKSDFLSSMSHELRTPLNAMLGFAQLLHRDKKEPLSKRHMHRVEHILQSGEHLLRLIDEVLDLSRIEARGVSLSPEPVNAFTIIQQVWAAVAPQAAEAGVELRLGTSRGVYPMVSADPTRLAQIVMNFATNAIKYNKRFGSVVFDVSAPRVAFVRLLVSDTGCGIPKEKQPLIFQPFQRAGQELGAIEGTGIGLTISKRLAELMGGSVGFTSSGEGSVFWVELPVHASCASSVPPAAIGPAL